jgi:DNA-binding Lrp family transcriptional regulator
LLGEAVAVQSDLKIDELDAALLSELQTDARVGVLELSRRLGIARGTVQSRIDRLVTAGVIRGFTAHLNLDALGFHVRAYVTVEVKEGQIDSVLTPLKKIDEVIEVHSVAAQGDMLCLVVARSNQHLMDVLEKILSVPDIARTSTAIVLKSQIENRCHQLLASLGQ